MLGNTFMDNRTPELQAAILCTHKAGEEILKLYNNSDVQVSEKSDGSPITGADVKAGEIIGRSLQKFGYAMLSEEMPEPKVPQTEPFWVVDPLDGTKDFLHRTGDFAVMIGLINQDEVQLGVVYLPLQKRLYFAEKGKGSYLQTEEGSPKRLSGNARTNDKDLRFVASRNHTSFAEKIFMESFSGSSIEYRGSAGVKLGLIAEQKTDCYIHLSDRLHLWDICAPELILQEAGGIVSDGEGKSVQYNHEAALQLNRVIAARSSRIHEIVMKKLYAT